jgi:hypothetical protein
VEQPPHRRKFELALMDIRRCLVDPPMEDRADALRRAAWGGDRFVESLVSDPERARALIDTVRAVRDSPGPGGTVAESRLMQSLCSTAFECPRSRSIAFGALNFLVETGAISEFQALDRIDEWKERNEPRR